VLDNELSRSKHTGSEQTATISRMAEGEPLRGYALCNVNKLIRPPVTVVSGGLNVIPLFFVCLFVAGTLRRFISELPRPIAVKI